MQMSLIDNQHTTKEKDQYGRQMIFDISELSEGQVIVQGEFDFRKVAKVTKVNQKTANIVTIDGEERERVQAGFYWPTEEDIEEWQNRR